jgi:NADH-quinone oxidoreductase subunit L
MTVPLMILAVLSATGGFLGLPALFGNIHWINHYLEPVFASNPRLAEHHESAALEIAIAVTTIVVIGVIWWACNEKYVKKKVAVQLVESQLPWWYRISLHKFYVDELYDRIVVKPVEWFGDFFREKFEPNVIDGTVNGLGSFTVWLSSQLRKIQTGNIGFYLLSMVIGMVLLLIYGLSKMNLF